VVRLIDSYPVTDSNWTEKIIVKQFDLWIRDPGWVQTQNPDPRSGSGMNNPDHNSERLKTIFWVKILKFFDADPGSGMEKIQIREKHPGSATLFGTLIFKLKCTRSGMKHC
jgi:hypothetical protein